MTRKGAHRAAPESFPRPASVFAGRDAECRRALRLLDRETLLLVYGIAGIGKTELIYRIVDDLRRTPRWRSAVPIRIQSRPHLRIEHILASLRAALVSHPGLPSGSVLCGDDLGEIVRLLDEHRVLVVVDDVHELASDVAADVLFYLSRHVREGRVLAASRTEIPVPPASPTPVVIRLGPLSRSATTQMVKRLASYLDVEPPDAAAVFRRSGGIPFYVRRELAGDSIAPASAGLDTPLAGLGPRDLTTLLAASIIDTRVLESELETYLGRSALYDLRRRFLVEVTDGTVSVHDLIREIVLHRAPGDELRKAHEVAARIHRHRFDAEPQTRALDAVATVRHAIAADDADAAWATVRATYRQIASAGIDHLLLEYLPCLRERVPDDAIEIDLVTARILARRSLIRDASRLLGDLAARSGTRSNVRYLLVAATVAQRMGRFDDAEGLLREARGLEGTASNRPSTALALADLLALRGDGDAARALLGTVRDVRATTTFRARWAWSLSLSYVLDAQFEAAAATSRDAARRLSTTDGHDARVLLAMLEATASAESDDVVRARKVVESVVTPAASRGGLRSEVASMFWGIVAWASGDMKDATHALEAAYDHLATGGDHILAAIAGHYLGRARLALGDLHGACVLLAAATDDALRVGLRSLVPHGLALHASALLASGEIESARACATKALESRASTVARMLAHHVLAHVLAIGGDIAAARESLLRGSRITGDQESLFLKFLCELERAETEILGGGDSSVVVVSAQRALAHYAATGRSFLEARAALALAAGLIAGGRFRDGSADQALARGRTLAVTHDYAGLQLRAALYEAALARRRGDSQHARDVLIGALRVSGRPPVGLDSFAVRTVLAGESTRQIAFLGLEDLSGSLLEGSPADLVIHVARATIEGPASRRMTRGRPTACAILQRLVDAGGGAVDAESLYRHVWGGRVYHPLTHRNTVYIAINRLRATLRELLPGRQVIETVPAGWRVSDRVVVRVILDHTGRTAERSAATTSGATSSSEP